MNKKSEVKEIKKTKRRTRRRKTKKKIVISIILLIILALLIGTGLFVNNYIKEKKEQEARDILKNDIISHYN